MLGNISQIDTPYLTETTSGLTYVVDRFKNWEHSGHITLTEKVSTPVKWTFDLNTWNEKDIREHAIRSLVIDVQRL